MQHPIQNFVRKRPKKESFNVSCHLISVRLALGCILPLMAVSAVGWLLHFPHYGLWQFLANLVIIPVIFVMAMRLKLVLSEDGINADSHLHKESLFGRPQRSWSDLHAVRLRKLKSPEFLLNRVRQETRLRKPSLSMRLQRNFARGWNEQGFLFMDFKSGGTAAFPLAGFSARALEDLFISMSRWANPMSMNPEVIALQRDILTGQHAQLDETYTRMWEESLRQSFEVTNYVPLLGGQSLQNGALTVLMQLASGGFSSVYLARNLEGSRLIVKEMTVPADPDDELLSKIQSMFRREAEILARLEHPNIVHVVDHFVENNRNYLVLDFVPGLTLRQSVQISGKFSEPDTVTIAKQLADILRYLHAQQPPVIHRDLTPDNVVIREPDKQVTLIDFGAANEFIGKVTGTLIGKQCYIPPEQFRGDSCPQSDIYAAGATIHFLLTGADPEPISQSHPKLVIEKLSPNDKDNERVSQAIDDIVARATALELENRTTSADELLDSLKRL